MCTRDDTSNSCTLLTYIGYALLYNYVLHPQNDKLYNLYKYLDFFFFKITYIMPTIVLIS